MMTGGKLSLVKVDIKSNLFGKNILKMLTDMSLIRLNEKYA